jgi:hypothetical protein
MQTVSLIAFMYLAVCAGAAAGFVFAAMLRQ